MRLLLLKLALFAPLMALVVLVNFFVDPANLYHDSFAEEGQSTEETIARYLAAGYNVTNIETLDERILQKHVIRSLPSRTRPEVVVLGSSRCQLIGENIFPGKVVLNNGVTGATVEDILAILNMYDSMDFVMDEILIELSPWYLNDNNAQSRWKSISGDYTAFVDKIQSQDTQLNKLNDASSWVDPRLLELVSFEYFQQSIKEIQKSGVGGRSAVEFSREEFADGFNVRKFYEQVTPLMDPTSVNDPDTLADLNKLLTLPNLFDSVKSAFPDQQFPGEIISMYDDLKHEKRNNENSDILDQNIRMLNRKVLEATFYETCPPSPETLTYPTVNRNNNGLTRLSSGVVSYPQSFRNQTAEQVSQGVHSFLNTSIFGLDNFTDISDSKLTLLERAIVYLKNRNVTVKLVLVPYHPEVYRVLIGEKRYSQALLTETIYRKLASKMRIEITGAYNSTLCRLTDKDFYDAMHPREDAYIRIFDTHVSY